MKPLTTGRNRIATPNLVPGTASYGERLFKKDGREVRAWNPYRSKLAAYVVQGGAGVDWPDDTEVLYLGAAEGTTVSHVSDLVPEGLVVAIEKSPRAARRLLEVVGPRANTAPLVADARRPDQYARLVPPSIDILYQDVAQSDQVAIFLRNADQFRPRLGFLAIKARSIAVELEPAEVFAQAEAQIKDAGHDVVESIDLGRYQRDHAMLTVRFSSDAGGAT